MRRVGKLKDSFLSFGNLHCAFKKAFKVTKTPESYRFAFYIEKELFKLQEELKTGIYVPGDYHYFKIYEPKERVIAVASFRDRVVHHALVQILEPIFERRFINTSYATRKGKGTHRAIQQAQGMMKNSFWYLKMDIRQYFPSMDHCVLRSILKRTIKDPFIMELCSAIIAKGGNGKKGLPIGNLTSQFLANVYLNPFDHYVKENLRVKAYVRYMDDMVFFSDSKDFLKYICDEITCYLWETLHLQIKEEVTQINTRMHGLSFLGARIFPSLIRVKRENFKRSFKKYTQREWQYKEGSISYEQYHSSMQSLIAHMSFWGNHLLKSR